MQNKKVIRLDQMPAKPEDPMFIMQDLETGECEPADDLATALFGKSVNPDEFHMEEVPGKQ